MNTHSAGQPQIFELGPKGIRLGQLLKWAGYAPSGGAVKELLESGLVHVNGSAESRRGAQLSSGDIVVCDDQVVQVR